MKKVTAMLLSFFGYFSVGQEKIGMASVVEAIRIKKGNCKPVANDDKMPRYCGLCPLMFYKARGTSKYRMCSSSEEALERAEQWLAGYNKGLEDIQRYLIDMEESKKKTDGNHDPWCDGYINCIAALRIKTWRM